MVRGDVRLDIDEILAGVSESASALRAGGDPRYDDRRAAELDGMIGIPCR